MISPIHQDILRRLALICDHSSEVRFGQLVAHLGFLAEDMGMRHIAEIDDQELVTVLERHQAELCSARADRP
jgi:hypothetical protein